MVVEAIPGNEQITVSIGGELPLSQRSQTGDERERKKNPLSQLVVSEPCRLARSFAKKIFKKNLWAQSSGEPIRR